MLTVFPLFGHTVVCDESKVVSCDKDAKQAFAQAGITNSKQHIQEYVPTYRASVSNGVGRGIARISPDTRYNRL